MMSLPPTPATGYPDRELAGQLVDAGRHAVERGLVLASGGNLFVRLRHGDRFAVTAAGTRSTG
jgi:ribulose-5-phosphate 4-epimerase/fuculose-1-phosphate aldolase